MWRKTSGALFCWVHLELVVLGASLFPARRLCVPPAGVGGRECLRKAMVWALEPDHQCFHHCAHAGMQSPPMPQFLDVFRKENDSESATAESLYLGLKRETTYIKS